jgi:hypothetical protein
MTIRRYAEIIGTPVIVIGGYILFGTSSGFLSDAWEDFVGPFLITYWIGLGFVTTWDVVRQSLHGASPTVAAVTGILVALVILMELGGPQALIDDPWLFGVAIAPALELALPWWRNRQTAAPPSGRQQQ